LAGHVNKALPEVQKDTIGKSSTESKWRFDRVANAE
jgi:hypothetical protein